MKEPILANQKMSTLPFAGHCARVEALLKADYGIVVITRDIPDPLTGDLDGLEIHIDYSVTAEQRLFLLAHLFGHTVQWNIDPRWFELGRQYKPPVGEELFPAILAYEQEAARYGLSLLHQASITTVDEWFSQYSACDQAYLLDFYRTGEKHDFQSFWPKAVALLDPKPIPAFTPTRRTFRMDGIVI
jgi:hypothetical protein